MSHTFTLPPSMLATAFPFHFVVNQELKIVQSGDVLQRICVDTLVGSPIEQHFQIYRPKIETSYTAIQKHRKSLFILDSSNKEMKLKGQFINADEKGLLFFLGSPWITNMDELSPLNIKLKDFAIHDPIVDFLFLLQAGETSLNETKKIAEELTHQQVELKNALLRKEMLADIADSQAKHLEETLHNLQGTQAQLIQHEKMSALGNLVAGVAHEINNPIGFLNGSIRNAKDYVQELLDHLLLYQQYHPQAADPVQENAEEIDLEFICEDLPNLLSSMDAANQRIKSISTSLRTFSRADTEHKVSANLQEGLDSTLLILKYRLKGNEKRPAIEVVKDYSDLPDVECFSGRLNQVFMNLLANAIDVFDEAAEQSSFSELKENPQIITVKTILCPEQNAVEIRLGDNGKGMTEVVKERIFEHLYTTKGVGKGTGLGLAIAQQIVVEAHSGQLEVQSEPGKGTEFCIRLPLMSV